MTLTRSRAVPLAAATVARYLGGVRHLHSSVMGSLIVGLALLLPEVGHNLAHHQAGHQAQHRTHGHQHGSAPVGGPEAALTGAHTSAGHLHLDLAARLPTRPPALHGIVFHVAALLLPEPSEERPLPPVGAAGLSPGAWTTGPPPPSRAPPRI